MDSPFLLSASVYPFEFAISDFRTFSSSIPFCSPQSNVTESPPVTVHRFAVIPVLTFSPYFAIFTQFRFWVTNMENVLTLNQKSQIVISKKIRKSLGLKPGDQLAAAVEGNKIVLRLKPKSPTSRLRGIGKGTWGSKTKIDAYLDKLRDEWERA
jgi:AbrB family looped-hinge helix DNA binding protein